jgi:hypothetical protein
LRDVVVLLGGRSRDDSFAFGDGGTQRCRSASSLFGGKSPNATAQAIVFSIELVVVAVPAGGRK